MHVPLNVTGDSGILTADTGHHPKIGHDKSESVVTHWSGIRKRSEFSPPVRIHHHIRHLVVYLIEDAHITIVRVLHDSMELQVRLVEDQSNSI